MKRTIFLLLISFSASGQKYVAEAPLSSVQSNGFYEIPLPPRITGLINDSYRNLRIIDDKGAEVPYLDRRDQSEYTNVEWKEFKIERSAEKNCCTKITILNEGQATIDNFLLQVKNADVSKTAVLRGSDDRKTWYALKENFNLDFGSVNGKIVTEVFDFPSSDYKFYQLSINDSTTSPLNIIGAWQVAANVVRGRYIEIPSVQFSSADSSGTHETWITVKLDTAHFIDKLELKASGPHLYRRAATIFIKQNYYDRRNVQKTRLEPIEYFEVISGQAPLTLIHAREEEILVRIENENNQPLKFDEVHVFQLKRSVVAWLEPGHQYKLAFEKDRQAPVYDLEYFKDSIPANPPVIEPGDIKMYSETKEAEPASPTYFKDPRIIWAAIILVIIALGVMVIRMLRDKNLNP
jgi:hypothetical protein